MTSDGYRFCSAIRVPTTLPEPRSDHPRPEVVWFETAPSGYSVLVVDPTGDGLVFETRLNNGEDGILLARCWHHESVCECDPTRNRCDNALDGAMAECEITLEVLKFVSAHPSLSVPDV